MKNKQIKYACEAILVCILFLAMPVEAETLYNVSENGVAAHGYDLVSYYTGRPAQGLKEYSLLVDGVRYDFASQANLEMYQKNPDKYQLAFGGWCAWAMLDGEKVDVDPQRFKIINGKVYLYYNSFFVDTLKKWNSLARSKTEKVLVDIAEKKWREISR